MATDPKKGKQTSIKKASNTLGSSATTRPAGERGYSNTPKGNYSGNAAPRVGGTTPKASGLKDATKKQHRKAGRMVRSGTGSGASKQAKASRKRI